MKFSSKKLTLTLLSASLLVGSNADLVDMKPNFKETLGNKNIVFGASIGGSSHITWVLSISEELGLRGHNVSFVTTTDEVRFGQPYPHINTVDIGPMPYYDKVHFVKKLIAENNVPKFMSTALEMMSSHYERDYASYMDFFKNSNTDVAICDHFMDSCIDAARTSKIPFLVTSTIDMSPESSNSFINNGLDNMDDSTTEFQTFSKRFYNMFIHPLNSMYYFWPHIQKMLARKRALGMDAKLEGPTDAWNDSIKLVNNLFGFSAPRPIGPLAEYVGPIIPKQYKPLTSDLEEYLNSHKRVAYIAFGQTSVPTENNIKLILTSLVESLESGHIDGFLWATVHSSGFFPDAITTKSGTTYNVSDMFDHSNPHARMIKWAPQTAILFHPSTALFLSHGGLGSWYESMYTGTPMVMFPFFGDQPANSLIIERGGLGGILQAEGTVQEAVDLIEKVAKDEDGEIMSNVQRYKALTQIHSEHGIIRGADVVEEVAYTHKNGKLPHRQSAALRMSFIKLHNLDLYAALLSLFAVFLGSVFIVSRFLLSFVSKQEPKLKEQ